MEEFKLTSKNEAEAIKKAVVCLRKGGILLYPTDTCYGLAADIFNETAFRKLYQLKEMSYTKPISIMVILLMRRRNMVSFLMLPRVSLRISGPVH